MFNWAIIGSGGIAKRFINTLFDSSLGQVAGVLTTKPQSARLLIEGRVGATIANPTIYESIDDLVADSNIDGVYVATPHSSHYEYCKLLLEAKKSVLCEKPIAMSSAQVKHLAELSSNNKVLLVEAMWLKTLPIWQRLKEHVHKGVLGDLLACNSSIGFQFDYDPQHRLFNKDLGGGVLLDIGVYPIALMQDVFGFPVGLGTRAIFAESGVDVDVEATLKFANNVDAKFRVSANHNLGNEFSLTGSKGTISIADVFDSQQRLILDISDNQRVESFPFEKTGFEDQLRQFIECHKAQKIENPLVSHAQMLEVMKIVDEINYQITKQTSVEN